MSAKNGRPRIASSELGEGDFAINYNASTGRPIRKARRTQQFSTFVDSAIVSDPSDDEGPSSSGISVARSGKRKRSPSPELSIDSEPDEEDFCDLNANEDKISTASPQRGSDKPIGETNTTFGSTSMNEAIQITINNLVLNVDRGHKGPVLLQIDLPSYAFESSKVGSASSKASVGNNPKAANVFRSSSKGVSKTTGRAGFLDLPAELRNDIYRMVFVDDETMRFDQPTNFSRSAAFLRTCRQVHEEGRSILYAENHFCFIRKCRRSGSYWENDWTEVGFKVMAKFLKSIGPTNIGFIRRMIMFLEDATPCLNPNLTTASERRFVYDKNLMYALRLLGDHGKLQKLDLHFHGRRRVEITDRVFMDHLTTIQADEVSFAKAPSCIMYPSDSKQGRAVEDKCLKDMVRRKKLYT